jgi:hypothetical protein
LCQTSASRSSTSTTSSRQHTAASRIWSNWKADPRI